MYLYHWPDSLVRLRHWIIIYSFLDIWILSYKKHATWVQSYDNGKIRLEGLFNFFFIFSPSTRLCEVVLLVLLIKTVCDNANQSASKPPLTITQPKLPPGYNQGKLSRLYIFIQYKEGLSLLIIKEGLEQKVQKVEHKKVLSSSSFIRSEVIHANRRLGYRGHHLSEYSIQIGYIYFHWHPGCRSSHTEYSTWCN